MNSRLIAIIPPRFRRRGIGVVFTIFVRALLNFLGLAVLLPVLLLILDTESIRSVGTLQLIYDLCGFTSDRSFVVAVCAGVVLLIAVKCLLSLVLYRTERNYIYDLYRSLSRRLYVSYFHRGMGFVKRSNSAVLTRNVNAVCFSFVAGVLRPIASMACDAMLFLLLFGALALYSAKSALLIVAVFLPTAYGYYRLVRSRLNRYGEAENRAHREKARIVAETFRGYPDVEIARAFPMMLRRFDGAMDRIVEMQRKNATLGMLPSLLTETGVALGMALLVVASLGTDAAEVRILFGMFAVAALRLMPSVRNIMSCWAAVKYNRYTVDILGEAHPDAEERSGEQSAERLPFRERIRLDGVSFHFDDAPGHDVLHDLSLTIRKGERLGIRGRSGAGKTTLFNLLLGFYAPTAGSILIDGTPLDDRTRRRWQNSVGYVSQTVFLTDSTFAANVALGEREEDMDRGRIARALEAARLSDFVATLPQGMDTPIGECGCRLSGGQRQRIGIARALYKQADVLFFDEATSSLDNRTEEDINHAIEALSARNAELTIVVIAHRESSLEYCDRIIDIER